MNLLVLALTALVIGSVVVRGSSRPGQAPDSPSYLAYRNHLRRNMLIAAGLTVGAVILTIIDQAGATSTGDSLLNLPDVVDRILVALIVPGAYLLPLAALCLTEYTTRPPDRRVATLTARTARSFAPMWLFVLAGVLTVVGLAGPLLLLSPQIRTAREFRAPRIDVSYGGAADLWMYAGIMLVAALLTVATIRQAVRRGDLDPDSASDKWSRSGVITRALCLLVVAGIVVVSGVADELSTAAWAYGSYLDGGGAAIDGYNWLVNVPVKTIANWAAFGAIPAVFVALLLFAFPPRPKVGSPVGASA